ELGTVCNTVFDHTSIIRTAENRWLNSQHLNERDKKATDLSEVFTLSTPRTDVPVITPNPAPPFTGCGTKPLSELQRHLLLAAKHMVLKTAGEVIEIGHIKTTQEAVQLIHEVEAKMKL